MALVIADRVKETSLTTGTSTIVLAGAAGGFQSFSVIGNGNSTYYCIAGQGSSQWEVGIGTYTASGTTLSRDTVLSSSAGGTTKVTFSSGTKDVFVTYPSEKSVNLDISGNVTNLGDIASGVWKGTTIATTYGGTGLSGATPFTAANNAVYSTSATALTAGTLPVPAGGTGLASYTAGDLSYYTSGTALTKLPIGASTTILTSSSTAPQWSATSGISVGNATTADTLTTARDIAGVPFNGSANIVIPLANLSDVGLDVPLVNQLLGYNGSQWTNTNAPSAGAGPGVVFYNATPVISAVGANNATPIATLATTPVVTAEQTVTGTASNNTVLFSAFISAALNRTIIDAGVWDFTNWIGVSSTTGSNLLTRQIYTSTPFVVANTVTITGTGTSRTATASGGTPFATAAIDASATNTVASYLQTPAGLYQITARTSDTVVTILTPSGYTNESGVVGVVLKKLFGITTSEITSVTPNYGLYEVTTTATSYPITALAGIGILGFFTSTTDTITVTYNGTTHNTHVSTPLANVHNDLAGLQGGSASSYYHSTLTEYTGTGTGVFVRATNPTLASLTDSGNLTFTGTGNRITGDFSNTTLANRVIFQSSTTNGNTILTIIPNGTSTTSAFQCRNSSDVDNNGNMRILASSADARVESAIAGTGTYLPMTFFTGGSERARIDTSGNVGIGTSSLSGARLDVVGSINNSLSTFGTADVASQVINNSSGAALNQTSKTLFRNGGFNLAGIAGVYTNYNGAADIGGALVLGTQTNAAGGLAERMRIDSSGNVGIGTATTTNAKLTVNANTVLPATAPPTGTNLWVTGVDATASRITIDAFGSTPSLNLRQSAGTAASPTAAQLNAQIGSVTGFGYGATAYSTTARASLNFYAAESWTDTAQGTYQTFGTTAIGAATNLERMRIDSSGNVGIGTASPTTTLFVNRATNGHAATFYSNGGGVTTGLNLQGITLTGNLSNGSSECNIVYGVGGAGLAFNSWNGTTQTERMRIDSSGNLLLGSTSATGTGALRGSYGTGGIASNFAAGDGALNANTSGTYNSAVGVGALYSNTTGAYNSAMGMNALVYNTTGNYNSAVGQSALLSNVSGSNNIAMGLNALYYNTADNNTAVGHQAMQGASGTSTGAGNSALGYQSLLKNTSGTYNSAIGFDALYTNSTGVGNAALGESALYRNTTGSYNSAMGGEALQNFVASNNTAVGYQAMFGVIGTSTGANNAALGWQSLYSNTSGTSNSALGYAALYSNTTGSSNSAMGYFALSGNISGSNNSAMGQVALFSNTAGSSNTAQGLGALYYNTASNNTAVGSQAMYGTSGTSTGTGNAALGYQALYANTTGGSNSAFGYQALFTNSTGSSNTGIGNSAGYSATGSNNTIVGPYQGALTPIMTSGSNWTVLSDGQANVKLAIDTNTAMWGVNGQHFFNQAAPTAKTAAATLTGAELLTGIITYNGLAASLTMPLGSALDTAITGGNLPVGFAFEFVVINLGAATATMAVNTNVTFVGVLTVLALASVRWRVRKTAASTFIVYRVSN